MNTDLTEKLEQLEANLRIDDYGDGNYVMQLLKEAQNLAINFTHCCKELNADDKNKHFINGYRQGYSDAMEDSKK